MTVFVGGFSGKTRQSHEGRFMRPRRKDIMGHQPASEGALTEALPRVIGYARVSTSDQRTDMQINALQAANCYTIYEEKVSGTSWTRDGLDRALADIRPGDKLAVYRLDRIGRSIQQILAVIADLDQRGASLISLTENLDTGSQSGEIHSAMLAMIAHIEHRIIVSRTRAGLQAAKDRGVRLGGKAKMTPLQAAEARALMKGGMTSSKAAERYAVSRATLFRALSNHA